LVFAQQFRKYTPLPLCAGVKFTDPVPFTTTLPVKPAGADAGVTVLPFVVPLTSVASRCNTSCPGGVEPPVVKLKSPEAASTPWAFRESTWQWYVVPAESPESVTECDVTSVGFSGVVVP
jgi:hypothetical protein